ncbi:MAG: Na(+)-translocating NADH-quinone reductase subunit C [bacterium]
MQNESIGNIVKIALGVCIVCSVLVSTAAVTLNGIQTKNRQLDRIKNILIAGDLYDPKTDIEKTYREVIEPVVIDLATGEVVDKTMFNEELSIEHFDIKSLAEHPEYGATVPPEKDIAQIKRAPKYMLVYLVKKQDEVEKLIFPIYGKGLWSTLYGFMALGNDLKTIQGLTFYEHGETPGLGGEVDNARWKKLWKGKLAYDEDWQVKITVIKGKVDGNRPESVYQIDGLSGATITTRGVDKLVKYWLGDDGYGRYLSKLRAGGEDEQG